MSTPIRRVLLSLLGIAVIAAAWVAMKGGDGKSSTTTATPDNSATAGEDTGGTRPSKSVRPAAENEGEEDLPEISKSAARWLDEGKANPTSALGRILALEDEEERREALDAVLANWQTEDRAALFAWMKSALPGMEEDIRGEIIDVVIGTWSAEEPLPAIDWVNRNLPEPAKTESLKSVAEVWSQADPEGMEAWIIQQPSPPPFWTGELIQGYIPGEPTKALEWCNRLTDPAEAEAARQNVIQSWMLNAPDEADAYLKQHPTLVPAVRPEEPPPP